MKNTKLANFRTPKGILDSFDAVCTANGKSRTAVIIDLMVNYILQEGQKMLNERKKAEALGSEVGARKILSFREWMAATGVGGRYAGTSADAARSEPLSPELDDHHS